MDAYLEFLQKRSDEIVTNDEKCKEINGKILQLEKDLLPMLSDEATEIYLKIEELVVERNTLAADLLIQKMKYT